MSSQKAYIKLVEGANQDRVTLDELKEFFQYYKNITNKAGTQLNWDYEGYAFPYEIRETSEGKGTWFYLKGIEDRYKYIVFAVGKKEQEINDEVKTQYFVQVELPEGSTYGDKGKANEFCKFLGKKLGAEVQLFNGRTMYFNKRK